MSPRWQFAIFTSLAVSYAIVQMRPQYAVFGSSILTFTSLLSVQWLALAIWKVILYPKLFSPFTHLPHPSGDSFFFGQFGRMWKEPVGMPMREWINEIPNDGIIKYNNLFNWENLLITSPAGLGEVLVEKNYDFEKPARIRSILARVLGGGILVAEGDEHKMQRKHLMPAFAYRHIKDLYPTFWEKTSEMVNMVSSEIRRDATPDGSAVIPFANWLNRTTLDIIGTAGMGVEFCAIQNPNAELAVTYNKLFKPTTQAKILGLLSILLPWSIVGLIPVSRNETVEEAVATVKGAARKVIQAKKRKMVEEKGDRSIKDVDIISVALESGAFSEEDLVIQTMTFLAAGHETTASTVKWALLILCRYPRIQQRLREEVRTNLPSIINNESRVTAEMFDKLPYLNAVCNEILRVWSPVAMTRREAIRDTTILGHFIPKGTEIHLSPYAVNMSKALWGPDALEFNPERWMGPSRANSGGASSNYAMLSFLHGPRSCIGQAFTKAEFAVLLAAVVGHFDFETEDPNSPIEIEVEMTSKPKGELRLRMKVVEGW